MATMYAISQQHPYAYATGPAPAPAPPPRYCSNHGTSSAFSSSAHPDEDWTKISDLAERRRIQNRIAQRNYRKKLKRRLEDLERRAGSEEGDAEKPAALGAGSSSNNNNNSNSNSNTNSSSSTNSHTTTANTAKVTKRQANKSKAAQQSHAPIHSSISPKPTSVVSQGQFTPPMESQEELMGYHHHNPHHHYDDRERSHTPPVFYTTYPAPDELLMSPYGAAHPYPAITTADAYGSHLAYAPPTTSGMSTPSLPSISHSSNPMKREVYHEHMSPYASYAYLPPPDMSMPSPYESAPLTPPLSHSYESTSCSEPGFDYPSTPLSMSGSPCMVHHHPHH